MKNTILTLTLFLLLAILPRNLAAKETTKIPNDLQQRAAQHIIEVGTQRDMSAWADAQLGERVTPLYRPDVAGVAYYAFDVVNDDKPAGFIILATGAHDHPIAAWSTHDNSPVDQLGDVERIYKLSTFDYIGEDARGAHVADTYGLPPKLLDQDVAWLDEKVELSETVMRRESAENDRSPSKEYDIIHLGPQEERIAYGEWASWDELKAQYGEVYALQLEALRRSAADEWAIIDALTRNGEGLFSGDQHQFALPSAERVSWRMDGLGEQYVQVDLLDGAIPRIRVHAIGAPSDVEENTTTRLIVSAESAEYTFIFAILPDDFQPNGGGGGGTVVTNGDPEPWSPYTVYWAGAEDDNRWYDQFDSGVGPNTSNCAVGCGSIAWSMLFGWGDFRAGESDPGWSGRWGIYRENGGTGANVVAPQFNDMGVMNMAWELRNLLGTFCVSGQGATSPTTMWRAALYLLPRTNATLSTNYNILGFGTAGLRNKAVDSIRDYDTPVIVGTGFLSHYPLTDGYRHRSRVVNHSFLWWDWQTTQHQREFSLNMGWGGNSSNDYVWSETGTWFVGRLYANQTIQTRTIVSDHSNKCLDVQGASTSLGANVQQYSCHGGANQAWRLEPVGPYFRILNANSGRALDVSGGSHSNGASAIQWEWHRGSNQLWEIRPNGDGTNEIRAVHSNKCLDVFGFSTSNGGDVGQWSCNGHTNQQWLIQP